MQVKVFVALNIKLLGEDVTHVFILQASHSTFSTKSVKVLRNNTSHNVITTSYGNVSMNWENCCLKP